MNQQNSKYLMLIRPRSFSSNEETLASNGFQNQFEETSSLTLIRAAVDSEFTNMISVLSDHNIEHIVYEDIEDLGSPDAIFPNNWVTFHDDGTVVLYPMMSPKRRKERRQDIIESLVSHGFSVNKIIDISNLENEKDYLEGTGSMILDRVNKKAYACISSRTTSKALITFSNVMNYEVIEFRSTTDIPVYHTNVMMSLGDNTALVCFEAIKERELSLKLRSDLIHSGRIVIDLSIDQMDRFLGNALEVQNIYGEEFLLMSDTAYDSLTHEQQVQLSERLRIVYFSIPTIEKYGGGSVRCMLAEIFLEKEH